MPIATFALFSLLTPTFQHFPNYHVEVQKAAYSACEEDIGEVTEN